MSAEGLFSLASSAALPGWLLLVFAPRWRPSARVIAPVMIPGLLALVYAGLLAARIGASQGGFGSLAEVRALFSDDWLLLAGWIHYLAFDLFVGAYTVRDAQRIGVPHLLVVPCLILTFLFGPVGLGLYLLIRIVRVRSVGLDDGANAAG